MLEEINILHQSKRSRIILVMDPSANKKYICKELQGRHPIYGRLQEMRHPYLPMIVEVRQEPDKTVVMEEHIEGATLDSAGLSERQLTKLLLELCDVLTFLHGHGILHRDIKPSNLMLAPDGHLRLIDFDAAREEKRDLDQDTRLLGTKGFAPPEQYGFAETDARSDIYAMGVTFRQLLGPLARKGRWRGILRKCTALDPKDRYRSTQQVKRAVWLGRVKRWVLRPAVAAAGLYVIGWLCFAVFSYFYFPEIRETVDTVGFTNRHYIFGTVDIDAMKKQTDTISVPYPARYTSEFFSLSETAAEAFPNDGVIFSGYADMYGRPLFGVFEWDYYVIIGENLMYGRFLGLCAVDNGGKTEFISAEDCDAHPEQYAQAVLALYNKHIFDTPLF